jgi:hypothetical protein
MRLVAALIQKYNPVRATFCAGKAASVLSIPIVGVVYGSKMAKMPPPPINTASAFYVPKALS